MSHFADSRDYNLIAVANESMAVAACSGAAGAYIKVTAGLAKRSSFIIHNSGSATCFIGATGAAEVNGLPLAAGDRINIDATEDIEFYVFAVGAAVFTSVMELK